MKDESHDGVAVPLSDKQEQADNEKKENADYVKSPCKALTAKRLELGWSKEHVASCLKITVSQVQAMEAGDYNAFHAVAIARGFVRAYAHLMQLDPEPLVAFFAKGEGAAPLRKQIKNISSVPKKERIFADSPMIFHRRSNIGKIVLALIVAGVIIVFAMGWYLKVVPWHHVVSKPSSVENTAVSTSQQPTKVEVKAVDSVAEIAPLILHFTEKSWIQIKTQDGKKVIAQFMSKPGEVKKIDISEPVSVVIGNINGVSMEFRNAPVDLKAVSKGNTAKLLLK